MAALGCQPKAERIHLIYEDWLIYLLNTYVLKTRRDWGFLVGNKFAVEQEE